MSVVLVTGATGNVGGPLVRRLSELGVDVRAAARRPPGDAGPEVESVRFDFTDPATFDEAFTGVRAMFLIRPPQLGHVARDVAPALARAKALGVEQVVFLSVQGADRLCFLPHARIEDWLCASGLGWNFLRASFFDQNLVTVHAKAVRERDELLMPAGRGRTAFVDAEDVAAVAAVALTEPARFGSAAWTLTGSEALTYGEVAGILTAVLGRAIRYPQPGLLSYAVGARRHLGLSPAMIAATSMVYTTARLGLAAGLTGEVERILGRPPTTMAAFVERERASFAPLTSEIT